MAQAPKTLSDRDHAILIRNHLVALPEPAGASTGREHLTTVLSNIAYYGYALSQTGYQTLAACSNDALVAWWQGVEPVFQSITGDDKKMDDFVVYKELSRRSSRKIGSGVLGLPALYVLGLPERLVYRSTERTPTAGGSESVSYFATGRFGLVGEILPYAGRYAKPLDRRATGRRGSLSVNGRVPDRRGRHSLQRKHGGADRAALEPRRRSRNYHAIRHRCVTTSGRAKRRQHSKPWCDEIPLLCTVRSKTPSGLTGKRIESCRRPHALTTSLEETLPSAAAGGLSQVVSANGRGISSALQQPTAANV